MIKPLALLVFGVLSVLPAVPVNADSAGGHAKQVDWRKRDTAIYVVSTVNLLRTGSGRPLANSVQQRMSVERFYVYADLDSRDLYFIQMRRDDGSVVGALAYQMGWPKPQSVSPSMNALGVLAAPDRIAQAYKSDRLSFFGAFNSTLPR